MLAARVAVRATTAVGGTMPVSHAMQERLHMARESSHCFLHFFFIFLFFPSISPHARSQGHFFLWQTCWHGNVKTASRHGGIGGGGNGGGVDFGGGGEGSESFSSGGDGDGYGGGGLGGGSGTVIFMIVPSNFSSVNELSADLRAYSWSLLCKY